MCWACYTPLTGAAVAAAGATPATARAAAAARPAQAEEKEKKPISPGLVGALALVLLIGLAVGLKALMTPAPVFDEPPPILPDKGNVPQPPAPGYVAPPSSSGGLSLNTGNVPPPAPAAFQAFALPNPHSEWGTMAIVPDNANLGPTQAAALAAFALRQYSKSQMQQWKRFYIFVFKDRTTARTFSDYVNSHKGAPLLNNDYEALYSLGVWPNALVRYEYRNQRERVLYPYKNPGSWWLDKSAGRV